MAVYGHLMVMHAGQWSMNGHGCGTFMVKVFAIFLFMFMDGDHQSSMSVARGLDCGPKWTPTAITKFITFGRGFRIAGEHRQAAVTVPAFYHTYDARFSLLHLCQIIEDL